MRRGHYWTPEDRIAEKVVVMLYGRGIRFGLNRKRMIRRIAKTIRNAEAKENE